MRRRTLLSASLGFSTVTGLANVSSRLNPLVWLRRAAELHIQSDRCDSRGIKNSRGSLAR
jgi:hypothetical protein